MSFLCPERPLMKQTVRCNKSRHIDPQLCSAERAVGGAAYTVAVRAKPFQTSQAHNSTHLTLLCVSARAQIRRENILFFFDSTLLSDIWQSMNGSFAATWENSHSICQFLKLSGLDCKGEGLSRDAQALPSLNSSSSSTMGTWGQARPDERHCTMQ